MKYLRTNLLKVLLVIFAIFNSYGQKKNNINIDIFAHRVFIKNNGQFDKVFEKKSTVDYAYVNGDEQVYFNKSGLTYLIRKKFKLTYDQLEAIEHGKKINEQKKCFVHVEWENSNPNTIIVADEKQNYYHSYGDQKLQSNAYKKITYKNIYNNIDIEYVFTDDLKEGIKYNILLHPGADIKNVRIKYSGDIKKVFLKNGNVIIKTPIINIVEHAPLSFQNDLQINSNFIVENNTISFHFPNGYNSNKELVIDPWISNLSLATNNYGYDVDYDYLGNYYVYGGTAPYSVAKYSNSGVLQWVFDGNVNSINWNSSGNNGFIGNFIVDKTNGKTYVGQGRDSGGTTTIRIDSNGFYDNFISQLNPSFLETWDMGYRCSDQAIFCVGGASFSNLSAGIVNTTTGSVIPQNFDGRNDPEQDIVSHTIDPDGRIYFVYASAVSPLANHLLKTNIAFNGNDWIAPTNYSSFNEPINKNYPGISVLSNGFNALASNNDYLYYYDGANIAAYNKNTGSQIGSFIIPGQQITQQGGIDVDECNNLYVGGVGNILCYHFDGTSFTQNGTIPIDPLGSNQSITDVKLNNSTNELYVCGDGFVGIYSAINTLSCSNNLSLNVSFNSTNLTATATITTTITSPVINYTWLNSNGDVISQTNNSTNLTNTITNLTAGNYTVLAQINGPCGPTDSKNLNINNTVIPIFSAVDEICEGSLLSPLPSTSNNGIVGTWSPALNNTQTTIYTFSPNPGQNALQTTLTITVNPAITPSFTAVPSICAGESLTALSLTSINGFTGTWSPALDNNTTTTYTFTPDAGQCATTTTLIVTVNPNITPTFAAVTPICNGGNLSALPTTSLNSFIGTWSPALDNTTTKTYTFTPNSGQCATTTTLTVTVNPNISPTFAPVAPVCNGGNLSALPTTSLNGFIGTWSPAIDNTTTATYTFTPNSGQCATTTTLTVTVNPNISPTFAAVAPICSNELLSPLPLISNNGITGTWSPALDNTVTTTYNFTPTAPQCATNTDLTIIVHPMPVLQVASLSPLYYCDPNNDGFGVFDITQVIPTLIGGVAYPVSFHETLIDAQIHGTTIPIPSNYFNIRVDQQTIYVRVESLTSNSCFILIPLALIVNPTPQATEPADYHVCDDNYDGFATFDLTSKTPEVLGTINPVINSINYYTSLADAQSSINPIINLTNFINTTINTQTLWIRVETIATGCFDIVTLQLVVDPLPNAMQPNYPPYTLCNNDQTNLGFETFDLGSKINDILLGQNGMSVNFYFSQADALSNSNPLPLLYVNSAIYVQTLWIRVENVFTGCFVLSTMDIRIEPLPSPIPQSPYTVCDSNQDGFSSFDLNTLTSDILQGANYTITYHETLTDAQLGSNSLVSPYGNLIPFIQFIYASALDNVNGCRSVIQIELNVEPKPKMPTNIPPIVQCDEDNNSQDLTMLFDLTQITPIVLAVQDMAASNYTVTYYITEADANAGLAPIIQSTAFTGTNNQIIWVRVENNASHCFAIGSFLLSINRPLLLTTPLPLSICDNDNSPNNQFTVFDLTVKKDEITQGQPNMTVTYYPSYPVTSSSVAIPNPTSYTNVAPAVQTLGVMVTNAQGCRSYTSLDIRVLPIPTPRTTGINPLPAKCDDNLPGDMLEAFDLTANAAYIINGDPTLTLHYYTSQADALADTNEILTPTSALVGQNVWIRVENNRVDYLGNRCFVLVKQPLTVNPLPIIIQSLTIQNCDDDTDEQVPFDLTSTTAALLGSTQFPADFTITYYTTAANAQSDTNAILNPTNFTNTTNPQIIYIRVVNKITGCVNYGEFTITVDPKPTTTIPSAFETCDIDGTNDGYYTLDLTTYINGIIGTQTGVTTTFYDTQTDAVNEINTITNLANYQAYTHIVWVRVENIITGCYELVPINITIEPLPEPIISSPTNNICVDYATNVLLSGLTLNSGLTPPNNYTFVWSLGGTVIPGATASTYDITTVAPGDYTVVATSTSSLACVSNVSNTFTVIQSGPAQFSVPAYTVSNPFEDNQVIVVNVVGFGQYEFSLDDGPFQINNIFENVSLGSHTITIRDVKGNTSCGEIVIDYIQTISYPHYFTPNGDGIHDTWNVVGLENEPRAKLYIFNRYGKLLKQLSTTGNGWDGTYNGYLLPSTDYWFKIEFPNLKSEWKEFKSHFSLKR